MRRALRDERFVARATAAFGNTTRTDLEMRIVNAISFAGRACVALRRDEAFLLNAIALEALLTRPNARAGVTDRLRLRVAHLIGRTAEAKRHLFDLVGRLYETRSELVHAGDAADVSERDTAIISELVGRALRVLLLDEPFASMKDAQAFDRWFEAQILQ